MKNKKFHRFLFICFALSLFTSCRQTTESYPTHEWPTGTPESVGISSELLYHTIEEITSDPDLNIHSMAVIRHGVLVAEFYVPPHTPETKHNLHSATKSFTSALVGIAVRQKLLKTDDAVLSFFPGEEFEHTDELKESMTVGHLLTMTSGIDWAEWFFNLNREDPFWEMLVQEDPARYILNRKVITTPGFLFNYNSGNSHLLAAILDSVIDVPLREYAAEELFGPLGIDDYFWTEDARDIPLGGINLHLKTRDMAKFGYLYLRRGRWEGRQIVSEKWVDVSTMFHVPVKEYQGYGYQWWIYQGAYAAMGAGGQTILVVPDLDIIIVLTQNSGNYGWKPLNYFFRHSLPKVFPDSALPENPEAYRKLQDLLTALSTEKVQEQDVPEAFYNIVGKTYVFGNRTYLEQFRITDIRDDELDLEFLYENPLTDQLVTTSLTAGLDNRFRMNPLNDTILVSGYYLPEMASLYPDPDNYLYACKASFPDGTTMFLNYEIPGSILETTFSVVISGDELHLIDAPFAKDHLLKGRVLTP